MVEPINNSKTLATAVSYAAKGQPQVSSANNTGNSLPKAEPVVQVQQQHAEPDVEKQQQAAVREIAAYVQTFKRELQFSVSSDTGKTIIHVVNPATGELVRTIPLDEAVSLADKLKSSGGGSLLNVRA